MGRTAVALSATNHCRSRAATPSRRPIDVHTGVGNFLNGAIPNQDMVAVSSGGDDGGSGGFGDGELSGQKRAFFAAPASEACTHCVQPSGAVALVFRPQVGRNQAVVGLVDGAA